MRRQYGQRTGWRAQTMPACPGRRRGFYPCRMDTTYQRQSTIRRPTPSMSFSIGFIRGTRQRRTWASCSRCSRGSIRSVDEGMTWSAFANLTGSDASAPGQGPDARLCDAFGHLVMASHGLAVATIAKRIRPISSMRKTTCYAVQTVARHGTTAATRRLSANAPLRSCRMARSCSRHAAARGSTSFRVRTTMETRGRPRGRPHSCHRRAWRRHF